MDAKLKRAWVRALRSGKYKQTTKVLKNKDGYCCLGVLCDVAGKRIPRDELTLDNRQSLRELRDSLGLGDGNIASTAQCQLTVMNDDEGRDFKTIANWIEKNV